MFSVCQHVAFLTTPCNRPYAIDVTIIIPKCETDSRWKSGYYAFILSGKNYRSLWSVSAVEQFASSFLTSAKSDFTFPHWMHKVSIGSKAHWSKQVNLPTCITDAVNLQSTSLYLHSVDRSLSCHSKWRRSIQISVHCPFHVRLPEVLHTVYNYSKYWYNLQSFWCSNLTILTEVKCCSL